MNDSQHHFEHTSTKETFSPNYEPQQTDLVRWIDFSICPPHIEYEKITRPLASFLHDGSV